MAMAVMGWFALSEVSYSAAGVGTPTSAKQGNAAGAQATNTASINLKPAPKTPPAPSVSTPKTTPKKTTTPKANPTPKPAPKPAPKPKPKPKNPPRLVPRASLGTTARPVVRVSQFSRVSLRLRVPLARPMASGIRRGSLPLSRIYYSTTGGAKSPAKKATAKTKAGGQKATTPAPKPATPTKTKQKQAPPGGTTKNGKFYKGGQYLPKN